MKAMKFRVKDEQHSKEIQEALFAAGYGWGMDSIKELQRTEAPFLYAEDDGSLTYSGCFSGDREEFFDSVTENEETILYNGSFIPAYMEPTTEQPAEEKPLVRPRKQFLQERQVELLKAMLADAEDGKMISDDYASELADNHQILESLT